MLPHPQRVAVVVNGYRVQPFWHIPQDQFHGARRGWQRVLKTKSKFPIGLLFFEYAARSIDGLRLVSSPSAFVLEELAAVAAVPKVPDASFEARDLNSEVEEANFDCLELW